MIKLPTPEEADTITPLEQKRIGELMPQLAEHLKATYQKGKTVSFCLGHVTQRVHDTFVSNLRESGWDVRSSDDQREGVNLSITAKNKFAGTNEQGR